MPAAAPRTAHAARTSPALQRADLAAADAVGALMELWGFRRQLGRVWAVLFLSDRPLAAPELCARLEISTGLLSMSLAELRRWGVVRPVEVPGDRKEHYEAETNVWRLVARVLREREKRAVEGALAAFERALHDVRSALVDARSRRQGRRPLQGAAARAARRSLARGAERAAASSSRAPAPTQARSRR